MTDIKNVIKERIDKIQEILKYNYGINVEDFLDYEIKDPRGELDNVISEIANEWSYMDLNTATSWLSDLSRMNIANEDSFIYNPNYWMTEVIRFKLADTNNYDFIEGHVKIARRSQLTYLLKTHKSDIIKYLALNKMLEIDNKTIVEILLDQIKNIEMLGETVITYADVYDAIIQKHSK